MDSLWIVTILLICSGVNFIKPGTEYVDFEDITIPLCKKHYQFASNKQSES